MKRCFKNALVCIVVASTVVTAVEAPHEIELLWPDGAPGAKGNDDGDKPSLTVYLPAKEKANGAAVVIFPGGGYGHLAVDHEGHQIAQWLNSLGVAGFIVKYRHSRSGAGYGHPAPLQDAQRAIRLIRSRAKQWNVDPSRIGIIGFSAGGHLASSAGTHFQTRYSQAKDAIDELSCRPDFMILMYPVVSFTESFTHKGSRKNLLGENPDKELVESLSNERQVTPQTPPTFLVHADDDKVVPPENSLYFYLALRKANVPAEMHVYEKGGHGFGPGVGKGACSSWMPRCADWMKGRGLLDKKND
ncbi:MAG: 1,4-beta-xylanase [Planctomycetes bacterium RBG_16_55_9]|nr:MAG: 1,4-beta-xylanase [Planctomycetes bacterium RBG_16_55_9]